jgi:hypothetical protein
MICGHGLRASATGRPAWEADERSRVAWSDSAVSGSREARARLRLRGPHAAD